MGEPGGGDARAGDERQQHGEDGGAEPAAGQRAGGGGQEGVGDGCPGAQQPGGDQRARGEVRGEAGQRHGADQQHGDREPGGAEQHAREEGDGGEVGRRGRGAAGADRVPGVEVARPQLGGVRGGGQQGAAGQGAAAEQIAARGQGDEQQHQEEHRAGAAGDALEAGELFDLQEVGVVAAGAGLDGAAVPAGRGRLGVGAAHEVARDLFDGGSQGGAGRREQGLGLVLVEVGPAFAAAGQDPLGPQQDAEESADLVQGLPGHLADEVGERAQQGADDDPDGHPGQLRAAGVDEEGVDGAGLVHLVRGGGGAAHAVDGAALAGGRLGVPYDGVGGDQDAVAGGLGAPAQVDVVPHQGQVPVEPAEFLEDVTPDQHAGGGDGQHGAHVVVLPLVLFAAVQPGPAAAGVGDGDADLQELPAVVPAAELGADDRHVVLAGLALALHDAEELGQGVGGGGAVVVQQPEPVFRFAVRQFGQVVGVVPPGVGDGVPAAGALEVRQVLDGGRGRGAVHLFDGLAEARAAGQVQHAVVAEGLGEQPCGVVRAAGVGGPGLLHRALLAEQPGERVGQPAGAVVGDEHRRHHVTRELWEGGVVRNRRVAVHGHRGTGPGSMDCGGHPCPNLRGTAGCLGRRPTLTAAQDHGPPPVDNPATAGRSWCFAASRGALRGAAAARGCGGGVVPGGCACVVRVLCGGLVRVVRVRHGGRPVRTVRAVRGGGRRAVRARPSSEPRPSSDRGLLQAAALALGQTAPDAEPFVVGERVLQALGADLARQADLLGLPRGAALLGEEGLGVGLGAQRALLPAEFLVRVVDQQLLHQLGHVRPSSVFRVPVMRSLPIPAERHE